MTMQTPDEAQAQAGVPKEFREVGVIGLRQTGGFVYEEYLRELQGAKGRKIYREMEDNSPVIGGLLYAIEKTLRGVKWQNIPSKVDTDREYAELMDGMLFEDMNQSWEDTISQILSMLTYGWYFCEVVWKRRDGMRQKNSWQRSKFEDGQFGIRKLAPRPQHTLDHWQFDETGGIAGMWQRDPNGSGLVFIPIEDALLFRTTTRNGNPEGKSLIRNAYRPYYMGKRVEEIEAIAINRELNGFPIARIPAELIQEAGTDLDTYTKFVRDTQAGEQRGMVLPSDPWVDKNGNMSTLRKIDVELIASQGTRAIDTDKVISRYDQRALVSVCAEFLLLGTEGGAYALGKGKINFFLKAATSILQSIASPFNRFLYPRIFDANGWDYEYMPTLTPNEISKADLQELGAYIASIAGAGITIAGDIDTENKLRDAADLPPVDEEFLQEQVDMLLENLPNGEQTESGQPQGEANPKENPKEGNPKELPE